MPDTIIIRAEKSVERPISDQIVRLAYGRESEVVLTECLRATAEFNPELSIVADQGGKILGYALYSAATVITNAGPQRALALAPIAVLPECQKQGIGERLVRHGLERCRTRGVELVFSIGQPQYFSRFGFRAADSLGLQCELPLRPGDLQAIDLSGRLLGSIQGQVLCPAPFTDAFQTY
jgi:putative acetyltransferase